MTRRKPPRAPTTPQRAGTDLPEVVTWWGVKVVVDSRLPEGVTARLSNDRGDFVDLVNTGKPE